MSKQFGSSESRSFSGKRLARFFLLLANARQFSKCLFIAALATGSAHHSWAEDQDKLDDLTIEQLMNIEVTSVSKKAQKLSDSPAAVFVLTNEDIRRSGATSIPEALRMVPGLNVARIDANKWAVSARGFNGRFANKLLVLVDGRAVYSPSFSGVYWESRDVMLEDLERIEVIRGPGATLWGANAVNGVINIITRHAADTQGVLLSAIVGDEEQGHGGVRIGAALGENGYGRAYVKGFKRDDFVRANGNDAGDTWEMLEGGFRADYQPSHKDSYTLQGDFQHGDIDQELLIADLTPPYMALLDSRTDVEGWNILGRWQHTSSANSEFTLKGYFDSNDRNEGIFNSSDKTVDIDFQHLLALAQRHVVVWGFGYRNTETTISGAVLINPGSKIRDDELFNFFIQDEIDLIENKLSLTLGAKVEHNDYTGAEIQPSARLMWSPANGHKAWFSVSQAVRTASRVEQDLNILTSVIPPMAPFVPFPVALVVTGNDDYDSEELTAWEAGYRITPLNTLSLDMTIFYNDYDQLRSTEAGSSVLAGSFPSLYLEQTLEFDNQLSGETYGFEVAAVWQATRVWRLDIGYSFLESDFNNQSPQDKVQNGIAPRHQVSLRSLFDVADNLDFDIWVRYVDEASAIDGRAFALQKIDSYLATDLRLAWRPSSEFELALVGQNIFDPQHAEYIQESFTIPTEVERGVYVKAVWQPNY
ncbi:MAG: TonB-dependent receptor [Porticoccaceae bacterium]|nr:TonB-dependent receptor [Porticoccaceae bacterium]